MGLLKVGVGVAKDVLADQWREYFYCDSMNPDVLVKKGEKRQTGRSFNTKGSDNLITNGSVIAVNEGQCMIIVDQGAIAEVCAEAGEFVYDTSSEPTIFYGKLSQTVSDTFKQFGRRFTFGADTGKDQRVYFFNTKEILGNKYGTASPVPFRVVDQNIGLDMDIAIRCHGEFAYRLTDPILFYKNICGNVTDEYTRDKIDSQLRTEMLTALQPALARISGLGVRYSALPAHTLELAAALNEVLAQNWKNRYGIEVSSIGVSSVTASEEDEERIKQLQQTAVFRNPGMAGAMLAGAQAEAMKAAAANKSTGPMMAFAGMNMAAQVGGMNTGNLFAMDQQMQQNAGGQANPYQQNAMGGQPNMYQQSQAGAFAGGMPNPQAQPGMQSQSTQAQAQQETPAPQPIQWTCSCGTTNTGKFCSECGSPRPQTEWTCSCGTVNKGKFCSECGKPRP